MKPPLPAIILACALIPSTHAAWTVVDTGLDTCFDDHREIPAPGPDRHFYGQDAQYDGPQPRYRDNKDATVTDLTTGLTWSRAVDAKKLSLVEAQAAAARLHLAGHDDWRVPTIKELYSLIDFRGSTGMAQPSATSAPRSAIPYINTDYFDFRYGLPGERYIDAQWLSSTKYVSTTMDGAETLFGVNFADGRIKGYGYSTPDPRHPEKKFYVRYVRGPAYGENQFHDNGDGTVTDQATGLMWTQHDSGQGMNWEQALKYAGNLTTGGHDDWRLPNAKELQSIVDYSRSPDTTHSPAIDPVFDTTAIKNEAGQEDWPFFWTSTTHRDGPDDGQAAYIAFGRAIGEMRGKIMDVHGAGAQRSDPKTGSARIGHGPQGDAQRVLNYVRAVRLGATPNPRATQPPASSSQYPAVVRVDGQPYRPEKTSPGEKPTPPQPPADNRNDTRRSRGNGDKFIQHLDRDGDGRVSRSEFDGPPDQFDILDRNHDRQLSADEAPPPPQK